jgi:hypothetical protein
MALRNVVVACVLAISPIGCGLPPTSDSAAKGEAEATPKAAARDRFLGSWKGKQDGEHLTVDLTATALVIGGAWGSMGAQKYRVLSESERKLELEVQTPEGPTTVTLELSEDASTLKLRDDPDEPDRIAVLKRAPASDKAEAKDTLRAPQPDPRNAAPNPAASASRWKPGELDQAIAGEFVIDVMNELCGDTYCEGAYEWTFKTLSCKAGTCTLAFLATHHDTNKKFDETVEFAFKGVPLEGEVAVPTTELNEAIYNALKGWQAKGKK